MSKARTSSADEQKEPLSARAVMLRRLREGRRSEERNNNGEL